MTEAEQRFIDAARAAAVAPRDDLTPAQCRAEVDFHMAVMDHETLRRLAALAGELAK